MQTDHAGELELSVGGPMGDSVAGGKAGVLHILHLIILQNQSVHLCLHTLVSQSPYTRMHRYISIYTYIHTYTYPAKCEEQACTKKHGN